MANREPTFQLYFRMARNKAFEMPDEIDRIKALKWIKKIDDEKNEVNVNTRDHAILLLLHALGRKQLVGPFEKMPDERPLTDYRWNMHPEKMSKMILLREFEKFGEPPVSIEIAGDLCEIVTYQEIPCFGAHFYYAYSPEKLQKWDNLDQGIIPKGLLPVTVVSRPDLGILSADIEEKKTQKRKVQIVTDNKETSVNKGEEFTDLTILTTSGQLKDGFIGEQPPVEGLVHTEILELANKSGILTPDDLRPDEEMA